MCVQYVEGVAPSLAIAMTAEVEDLPVYSSNIASVLNSISPRNIAIDLIWACTVTTKQLYMLHWLQVWQ